MSRVNDDCYVHYYIQQQNASIAMETFLSTPAPALKQWQTVDSSLRVGLCLNTSLSQQSWEWPGSVWRHSATNLWMAWSETVLMIYWDFYHYRVVLYTHCQHTFQFKQHIKVNFASDDSFKYLSLTETSEFKKLLCRPWFIAILRCLWTSASLSLHLIRVKYLSTVKIRYPKDFTGKRTCGSFSFAFLKFFTYRWQHCQNNPHKND